MILPNDSLSKAFNNFNIDISISQYKDKNHVNHYYEYTVSSYNYLRKIFVEYSKNFPTGSSEGIRCVKKIRNLIEEFNKFRGYCPDLLSGILDPHIRHMEKTIGKADLNFIITNVIDSNIRYLENCRVSFLLAPRCMLVICSRNDSGSALGVLSQDIHNIFMKRLFDLSYNKDYQYFSELK